MVDSHHNLAILFHHHNCNSLFFCPVLFSSLNSSLQADLRGDLGMLSEKLDKLLSLLPLATSGSMQNYTQEDNHNGYSRHCNGHNTSNHVAHAAASGNDKNRDKNRNGDNASILFVSQNSEKIALPSRLHEHGSALGIADDSFVKRVDARGPSRSAHPNTVLEESTKQYKLQDATVMQQHEPHAVSGVLGWVSWLEGSHEAPIIKQ